MVSDSDDLYTLRKHFFTGEFEQVSKISTAEYFEESRLIAISYKLRSLIVLSQFSEAESVLSGLEDSLFKETFGLYIKFVQGGDVDAQFDKLISSNVREWVVEIIGTLYLVKKNEIDRAIVLLQHHESSLECVLLLTELYIHTDQLAKAEKEVGLASEYAQDSIIYNLAEAYLNSVKNGEALRGSLYFFEELSHTDPSFKALISQVVLNLQLHQFPEAEEAFRQIHDLKFQDANLLANEITYASITGDNEAATAKKEELSKIDPQHPFVLDYQEKNALFDDIVKKYSAQVA